MIVDEESPAVKKSTKKRVLVEDDEEVATIEESVATPAKPAPVTPGKQSGSKKSKMNDGKAVEQTTTLVKENVVSK